MGTKIDCAACGQARRPSVTDRARCERCVGEPIRQVCVACGAEEKNHTAGRCARCSLGEILRPLRADGDPDAIARLEPYLRALGDGLQPATTLKWIARSGGYETVIELASGAREVSHAALDQVNRGMTTTFLRAALVTHGVLDARAEQTAKFDLAAARLLGDVPASQDRAQLREFSLWQVQHELARRERHGRTTRKSAVNSMRLVRAAVELSAWATAHGITLAQLRQEDLDRWIHEAPSTTANIRPFLKWAARGQLIAPLQAAPRTARGHAEPLADHDRVELVRRLLRDEAIDLRDRVAGCLVLVYAQPLTRIVVLTADQVTVHGDRVTIALGDGPLELPEPLARLTATLARTRRARASTAATRTVPAWLFPGMRVGQPLDCAYLQRRLGRLGIRPLAGRTSAVMTLAGALPPTILADLLGISETTATKWYRLAGGEWSRYAAHRVTAP